MTADLSTYRSIEHAKYARCYSQHEGTANAYYGMGKARRADAQQVLRSLRRGSLLDVSCGRGELLGDAETLGYGPVQGTEIVASLLIPNRVIYAEAHALPFGCQTYDMVCMLDVLEHLLPGDDERAFQELCRVAKRHVFVTVANYPHYSAAGEELHINCKPYDEWQRLFAIWAPARLLSITRIETVQSYVHRSASFIVRLEPR